MSDLSMSGFGREGVRAEMPNYYEVLRVEPGASRLEIRETYLRLKNTYGKDSAALYSLMSEDEARESMALVEEAFRVLNDDVRRSEYDRTMGFAKSVDGAGIAREGAVLGDAEGFGSLREDGEGLARPAAPRALPIVQTRVTNASSQELQTRYEAIIAESDPGDGDLYRRLRQAAGVTEDELQERTKVSRGHIADIEENRFDRLPPLVYVKGFLRSILRYLAVPNPERLVNAYAARLTEWHSTRKS